MLMVMFILLKVKSQMVNLLALNELQCTILLENSLDAETSTLVSLWGEVILCHTIEGYEPIEDKVFVRVKESSK